MPKIDITKPKIISYVLDSMTYDMFGDVIDVFNASNINIMILSFYMGGSRSGPFSAGSGTVVESWENFTKDQKKALKQKYEGIIMLSVGGATNQYVPRESSEAETVASECWKYVKDNLYDGLDMDIEITGDLVTFGTALVTAKPENCYFSLVPQAHFYYMDGQTGGAGYLEIYRQNPEKVDWISVQYYNNGVYHTLDELFGQTEDNTNPITIQGLITGVNKDSTYCPTDRTPLTCNRNLTIPPYKIVPGSCQINGPGGCSSTITESYKIENALQLDKLYDFIETLQANPIYSGYDYSEWLQGSGAMAWVYSPSNHSDRDKFMGKAPLNAVATGLYNLSLLFGAGSDPCRGVDCGPWGKCTGGICTCSGGTSGLNCDILPTCTPETTSEEEIVEKPSLKNSQKPLPRKVNIPLIISGSILIIGGIILAAVLRNVGFISIGVISAGIGIALIVVGSRKKSYYQCQANGDCKNVETCDGNKTCYTDDDTCGGGGCPKPLPPTHLYYQCQANGDCKNVETCDGNKTCYTDDDTCGGGGCPKPLPPTHLYYQCQANGDCKNVETCDGNKTCYTDDDTCGGGGCPKPLPPISYYQCQTNGTCKQVEYCNEDANCFTSNTCGNECCQNKVGEACVPCNSMYHWTATDWNPKPCTSGKQTRTVSCVNRSTGVSVGDEKCSKYVKLPTSRDCVESFFMGDGLASTTVYTSEKSTGQGACGGCSLEKDGNLSYQALFEAIRDTKPGWTLAASSEAMAGGISDCCPKSTMCCSGRKNPSGNTANAPCGTCWNLKSTNTGNEVNVIIADLCPCGNDSCGSHIGSDNIPTVADNSQWCRAMINEKNSVDRYNHFDIWNGHEVGFSDTDNVKFTNIECPVEINSIMKKACCSVYDTNIGCPRICGANYKCVVPPN
jgi:hypothetical protein